MTKKNKLNYLDNKKFTEEVAFYNEKWAYAIFHKRFLDKFKRKCEVKKLVEKSKDKNEYLKYLRGQIDFIISKSITQDSANAKVTTEEELEQKASTQKLYYNEIYSKIEEAVKKQDELDFIEYDKPNDYIGKSILDIATELTKKPNFFCYAYKDELIYDAVYNCVRYICNFSYYNDNAMSYFTAICYGAFIRKINRENNQKSIVNKSIEHFLYILQMEKTKFEQTYMSSNINDRCTIDFIEQYLSDKKY